MSNGLRVNGRSIGEGHPVYIIAELSGNHGRDFDRAVRTIEAAASAGADAVKLQTYTPDTMTLDCHNKYFVIEGTPWHGKTLHELYSRAYTPWEWQPKLKRVAAELGMTLFSTPFDRTAVDFLEEMDVPCFKVASFEIVDLPLLRKIASTKKPVILSTGMATLGEIDEAVTTLKGSGCSEFALLKCTSAYPAPEHEMNLRTIPHLQQAYGVPTGLSDHTLGTTIPVAAVSIGASIIEKHLTLSRSLPSPDNSFSLEPEEFRIMVEAVRTCHKALGNVHYGTGSTEQQSAVFRRSLFVVEDMKAGATFTSRNLQSIRPGYGLHPRYLETVLGRRSSRDIVRGTPLDWELIAGVEIGSVSSDSSSI